MGGRGSFVDVKGGNFDFVDGGQKYFAIGYDKENNIKYLIQPTGSVKVPDYSHTGERIYVIIQDGEVKSIGIYENHVKVKSIDLKHTHTNKDGTKLKEHYHSDLYHQGDAHPLSQEDLELVERVKKGAKKYIWEKMNMIL